MTEQEASLALAITSEWVSSLLQWMNAPPPAAGSSSDLGKGTSEPRKRRKKVLFLGKDYHPNFKVEVLLDIG